MHIPLKKKKEENTFEEDNQKQETVKEQQLDEIRSVITFEESKKQPQEIEKQENEDKIRHQEKTTAEQKENSSNTRQQPNPEPPESYIKTIRIHEEEITTLAKKVEQLALDLDDLVSLYEIVSEQMNPFVGLSKVTKKRLDTLENFISEIETLKTRMDDFEAQHHNNTVKTPSPIQQKAPIARPNIPTQQPIKKPDITSYEFDLLFNETLDILSQKKNVDQALQELLEKRQQNYQEDNK